jgi:hypothetical protein
VSQTTRDDPTSSLSRREVGTLQAWIVGWVSGSSEGRVAERPLVDLLPDPGNWSTVFVCDDGGPEIAGRVAGR